MTGYAPPPTVSTDSIRIMATIDENYGRTVGICDIPDAFLSSDMDKAVKMALRGRLTELMVKLHPRYTTIM